MLLGPPKSKAGRRIVGIPAAIIPDLTAHLAIYAKDEPGALVFPGAKGGPIRRGNFNKMAAWPQAVASIGMPGLHFHDLRHTGNQFAATSGAGLRDLMARMGHDSERAAMIYQHVARGADQMITSAIDTHVQGEKRGDGAGEDGAAGALVPAGEWHVNGTPSGNTARRERPQRSGNIFRPGAFFVGAGDGNRTRTVSLGS